MEALSRRCRLRESDSRRRHDSTKRPRGINLVGSHPATLLLQAFATAKIRVPIV